MMGAEKESKTKSLFAQEFQRALDSSRLGVQDVAEQLHRYGHSVSMKTFSNWLQGYFLPRHGEAFRLVETLEKTCGVRSGRLRDALLDDLMSGESFVPEGYKAAQGVRVPKRVGDEKPEKFLEISDSQTNWEEEIIREVIHDQVVLNSGRNHMSNRTTILGRIPNSAAAFLNILLAYEKDEMPEQDSVIYDVQGGEIIEQNVGEENGLVNVSTRIKLLNDAVPGALHRVSYTYDALATNTFAYVADRDFAFPLAFYSCSVTFEGEVPDNIEYVFSLSGEGEKKTEIVTSLTPIENTVRVSYGNAFNGIGCVRWG